MRTYILKIDKSRDQNKKKYSKTSVYSLYTKSFRSHVDELTVNTFFSHEFTVTLVLTGVHCH